MLKKLNQKIRDNAPVITVGLGVACVVVYYKVYSGFCADTLEALPELFKDAVVES